MIETALIFANGEINDGPLVRRALAQADRALIIAADGGAHVAVHFGLRPQVVIGDMDSIDPGLLADLEHNGAAIHRYPAEKNETDLELALIYAAEHDAAAIRVIGAVGGRLDQTLSNIYLLALPPLAGCDVRLVADAEETWLVGAGEHDIDGSVGDTISLLPISKVVRGVTTEALYYPLRDEDLYLGPARGVSNVMRADHARVTVREGMLLIVHRLGRA